MSINKGMGKEDVVHLYWKNRLISILTFSAQSKRHITLWGGRPEACGEWSTRSGERSTGPSKFSTLPSACIPNNALYLKNGKSQKRLHFIVLSVTVK